MRAKLGISSIWKYPSFLSYGRYKAYIIRMQLSEIGSECTRDKYAVYEHVQREQIVFEHLGN